MAMIKTSLLFLLCSWHFIASQSRAQTHLPDSAIRIDASENISTYKFSYTSASTPSLIVRKSGSVTYLYENFVHYWNGGPHPLFDDQGFAKSTVYQQFNGEPDTVYILTNSLVDPQLDSSSYYRRDAASGDLLLDHHSLTRLDVATGIPLSYERHEWKAGRFDTTMRPFDVERNSEGRIIKVSYPTSSKILHYDAQGVVDSAYQILNATDSTPQYEYLATNLVSFDRQPWQPIAYPLNIQVFPNAGPLSADIFIKDNNKWQFQYTFEQSYDDKGRLIRELNAPTRRTISYFPEGGIQSNRNENRADGKVLTHYFSTREYLNSRVIRQYDSVSEIYGQSAPDTSIKNRGTWEFFYNTATVKQSTSSSAATGLILSRSRLGDEVLGLPYSSTLCSAAGQRLYDGPIKDLDHRSLAEGLYFLTISFPDRIEQRRVLIIP
jgi:hypothetical protein